MGRKSQSTNSKLPKIPSIRFVSCHVCLKLTNQYAECSIARCKNFYCFSCILEKFNKDFKPQNYVKQYWVCYSCGGSCKCLFCTGIDRNRKKRKPKPQVADSVSVKSSQKKDKEENPSQIDNIQNAQYQGSSKQVTKKRKIYESRRLPIKRNVAFRYKTKKRSKSKNPIDVKSLLQNIKPEDKIFKIKKDQMHKGSSDQQSQEDSSSQEESMRSGSQKISSINEEKKEKIIEKQGINEKQAKKTQQKNERKPSENNSSSLDYLEEKAEKQDKNQPDINKTKPIRKSNRSSINLSKLPTIKGMESKKEMIVSKQIIQPQESKDQSQQKSESQSQSISQEQKRAPNRRGGRRGRGSRSRTRGVGRRSEFKLKTDDVSDQEKEEKKQEKQKPRRGGRRVKRTQVQNSQQSQKKPISSRQAKQIRDLMQGSLEGPRRRSQKNYAQIQQMVEQKMIQQQLKDQESDQDISIKPENQSVAKQESIQNVQSQKGSSVNGSRYVRKRGLRNVDDEIQNQEEEDQQKGKKFKRNSMVKKHYQEELQKNIQFQVDSSDSQQPHSQINQPNSSPKLSHSSSLKDKASLQPHDNQVNPIDNTQKPQPIKQKLHNSQQKSNQPNSQQKSLNITVTVYRKPIHHKKNLPQVSQVAHIGAHNNSIANKWKKIQDNQLIDIRNIQKLGMQALFSRQNLTKEMNDLMKRRNLIMQKIKNQSDTPKQLINLSAN